jgi:phosphoribosylaminoimidazolecarboxamide formyltransferase/IMP cyclohydrolase
MLDGRVKTLHPDPRRPAGAPRSAGARAALQAHGIDTIDLLVVNLYPFEATVAKPAARWKTRSRTSTSAARRWCAAAAKNWKDVAVLTDASQYAGVLAELQAGGISQATRFALAVAAFNRISATTRDQRLPVVAAARRHAQRLPGAGNGRFVKLQDLRYGENPHQQAAFYRDLHPAPGSLVTAVQLQGKELSYNNIADADAAWECVKSSDDDAGLRDRQARQPLRRRARQPAPARPTPRPSRPTRPRRSAASSRSTAKSTAPREQVIHRSSSRC